MLKRTPFLFPLLILMTTMSLFAQVSEEEPDLARIADDLKYDNARHFYEMRLYDKAMAEMNEYLEIHINGLHRKEAYMTIADIHYRRFDYRRAARTYTGLYEEFSGTDEGIQAYLNAGICHDKMGNGRKARDIFNSIIEDHPDSRQATMARTQLEIMELTGQRNTSSK